MKYHLSDPPRERDEKREKSPEDFYPIKAPPIPPEIQKLVNEEVDFNKKRSGISEELLGKVNAKDKSKSPKGKHKKVPAKSNKTAMAKV